MTNAMSSAVEPLADVPQFTQILTMFSNPVLGMLAGLVLTAIIQSSSASVGILQALCSTGSLGFATVIPIIMGQNIGTCVTALLSSMGANIKGAGTNVIRIERNGRLLLAAEPDTAADADAESPAPVLSGCRLQDIFDFAIQAPIESIDFIHDSTTGRIQRSYLRTFLVFPQPSSELQRI